MECDNEQEFVLIVCFQYLKEEIFAAERPSSVEEEEWPPSDEGRVSATLFKELILDVHSFSDNFSTLCKLHAARCNRKLEHRNSRIDPRKRDFQSISFLFRSSSLCV